MGEGHRCACQIIGKSGSQTVMGEPQYQGDCWPILLNHRRSALSVSLWSKIVPTLSSSLPIGNRFIGYLGLSMDGSSIFYHAEFRRSVRSAVHPTSDIQSFGAFTKSRLSANDPVCDIPNNKFASRKLPFN
jgi:hypothetical protein